MNIQGKKVRFVFERENVQFPKINFAVLKLLSTLAKGKPEFEEFLKYYYDKNLDGIVDSFQKLTEEQVISFLEKHPEFITSDLFTIHIKFTTPKNKMFVVGYLSELSGPGDAFFQAGINPNSIALIAWKPKTGLEEVFHHEFIHHLDRKFIVHYLKLEKKVRELTEREGATFSVNSSGIIDIFYLLRYEGVAHFASYLRLRREVPYRPKKMRKIVWCLKKLCQDFKHGVHIIFSVYRSGYIHEAGAMMVGIIMLYHLLNQKQQFSIWVDNVGTFGILSRRKYEVTKIGELYNKIKFDLCLEDKKIDPLIWSKIDELLKLNHIQFLVEYEKACKYLKIEMPLFDSKSYYYYKNKCRDNYRRLKKIKGFK